MKTFYDLTDEEKISLTENQVQYYAKLDCANQGIIIPQKPINNLKEVQPPTQKFYQVGYESIVFETEQDAQDYVNAKQKGFSTTYIGDSYNSREQYTNKAVNDVGDIKSIVLYTKEEAIGLKQTIKYNQETQKEWDEYNKALENYNNIERNIWSEIEDIKFYNSRQEYYQKVYDDYTELANGDLLTAHKFFEKAYKNADLTDIDKEIVDAIINIEAPVEG